jgi:glucuronosyltransferase
MEAPPSFVPAMMSRMGQKMNFIERLLNLVIKIIHRVNMMYHTAIIDTILSDQLPASLPSSELLSNLNGMLINTDYVLDYARPQPPTFINVGGLQIKPDPGRIPQDMLRFIEGSEHGVVLFTMGFIFDPTVR